ncbi:hypothetical protein J4226_03255 [Candidatus Pacearchaeota archaeon]|nr:hypothetical protein [Candidatus Pacearchaeota archaeon]
MEDSYIENDDFIAGRTLDDSIAYESERLAEIARELKRELKEEQMNRGERLEELIE